MNKKGESQKNHRIQVFARCRPLNSTEIKRNSTSVVEVKSEKEIVLKERNTTREFLFDEVFPPKAKQIDVYKSVVAPLIKEVLNGYNCTVFAYGQTGTGKTYTMEGERSDCQCSWEDDPEAGIIPRSLHQLFEKLNEEDNVEFSVRVSFLELYNEELIDLLSSSDFIKLRLFEDTTRKGSVIIQGLEEIIVNNKNEVYSILEKGTSRRQTAATSLNAASSRSHTIFSVTVHIKENTIDGEELLKTGKLNLVDLAGSENVGRSGAIEKRAREAGSINQSLLTLGRVITALIEKQPHIPYRESKLTRLLQDSLGGHTKTSIIATVSPAQCNFDETISTLDYATKAKSITIRPEANKKMTKRALIREYTEEIEQLRKDLDAQRSKDGIYLHRDNYENLQRSDTEQREQIKRLTDQLEALVVEKNKIEQLFASTKEELGKTSEILDDTTKKYEETVIELSSKKEVLGYTQEVLSKTILERDEKQYLINVHKNTEKKLTEQASTVLHVTDEVVSDNDKLHEKIGRKQVVENTNERLCHDFRKRIQLKFAELDDSVSKLKDEQINGLDSTAKQCDSDASKLEEKNKETLSNLLHDLFQVQVKYDALTASLKSQTIEKRQLVDGLKHENDTRKTQYIAELQTFLMEVLPKHLIELQANQTKREELLQYKKNLLDEMISNHNKRIVEQAKEQKELVESAIRTIESFHAHNDKLLEKLNKQLESLSDSKELDKLKAAINAAVNDYHSSIECKVKEAKETSSGIHNNSAGLQTVSDSQLSNLELRIKEAESDQLNLKEVDEIINVEEFSAQDRSFLLTMTNKSADDSKTIKNIQQKIADDYEKCKKDLENLDSKLVKEQENNDHAVNVLKSSLSEIVEKNEKSIKENNESLRGIAKRIWNSHIELKNKQVSGTAKVKDEVLKCDLEFEKFVTEDLVKDVPTGTTPLRKTIVYPRVLAATSPDERILQRYRSRSAVDIERAVATPLDNSFHESPESKLSPIEESGKLNSDSSSFTAEDYESAGCDSDSNSSTMSDTGERYKNKENCRSDKKSRLPKRHKFLVPAPPQIRKPLFSNNSDVCLN